MKPILNFGDIIYYSWIYMQNHENQVVLEVICHTVKPFWRYKKHVLCLSNGATPKCTEKSHHYWSIHTPPKTKKHESLIIMASLNRAFSLTWAASTQIHWNKLKESVCIRKEFNSHGTVLGHQHGRRCIVLGHQYGRRDVMWKHSIQISVSIRFVHTILKSLSCSQKSYYAV